MQGQDRDQAFGGDPSQKLAGCPIGEMAAVGEYAPFKHAGVGTSRQHVGAVVGFEAQHLAAPQSLFGLRCGHPGVRDHGEMDAPAVEKR
jgi:hypothetical protein